MDEISQFEIIESLPAHLRPFVALQEYELYTPRDHAVWRFLLHQLRYNLRGVAEDTYFDGLARTGIGLEAIPRIEQMNACLSELGWRAVVVDGFLPPAVFMEFQANRVLVIAVNIRSFEHMLYTPAPDIVHESAGHAPFLIDIDYAEFLQRFGELGMRAISSQIDWGVYEGVREISILKERADTTDEELQDAEDRLEVIIASNHHPSEATALARLHWWTVEYGLVGPLDQPKIFGAGLLSSLSESQSCMDHEKVKKYPLTVNVIDVLYQITDPQPQLFVTESTRHMSQVLGEFSRSMCCNIGGTGALQQAIEAATVNTATTNSGVQISGKFSRVITDAVGNTIYINTDGPSQLAYENRELDGQGIDHHKPGFGSPIGRLRSFEHCLSRYTVDELRQNKIELGKKVELNFLSGIQVSGLLKQILRRNEKNIVLSFTDCTVLDQHGETLFAPDWGTYDMIVGEQVVSVYSGSADQSKFPLYQAPSDTASAVQQYPADTESQFAWYQKVRDAREANLNGDPLQRLLENVNQIENVDWLLLFEAYELAKSKFPSSPLLNCLREHLDELVIDAEQSVQTLVNFGLQRLAAKA